MVQLVEDAVVEITDPRAIRAIAHPARLLVLDALYDQGRELTATEAAELAGITPSAMSYHLRALERFGIVQHAEPSLDGRQRPWARAAKDIQIRPSGHTTSKASASATGAVLSVAIDVVRERLLRALSRVVDADEGETLPLQALTRFSSTKLVLTPEEGATLLVELDKLIEPLRAEHRDDAPDGAGEITFTMITIPETEVPTVHTDDAVEGADDHIERN